MKSVMIGIPGSRHDQSFWSSMSSFLPELEKKYKIEIIEVKNKLIADAREDIVEFFLSKDFEYLLFIDDDHSGHTIEMFDALLEPNEMICAVKCYARVYPHISTLMDYSGYTEPRMKYAAKNDKSGYHYCNLVGFGMTLIKKEVFKFIKKPYFFSENNCWEDNYFCDKLQAVGIKPLGCFDYVLTHNGIDDSNVNQLNEIGTNALKRNYPEVDFNKVVIVA